MLKIVSVPNKILTSANKPIVIFDKKLADFVKDMEKTLIAQIDPQGVGLAAPQVGQNLQLFIIKPAPKAKIEAFINPKIIKYEAYSMKHETKNQASSVKHPASRKPKIPLEGCLSIPRIWGSVKRLPKLLLEYQTVTGEKISSWFSGFKAVIIQHEMDHLSGILFTQRVLEQKKHLYEEKEGKLEKLLIDNS